MGGIAIVTIYARARGGTTAIEVAAVAAAAIVVVYMLIKALRRVGIIK